MTQYQLSLAYGLNLIMMITLISAVVTIYTKKAGLIRVSMAIIASALSFVSVTMLSIPQEPSSAEYFAAIPLAAICGISVWAALGIAFKGKPASE